MISYNAKHWFKFIFQIHKAETFRQLFPLMVGLALYSAVIVYFMLNIIEVTPKSKIAGLSVVYSVLGFVISMLLVFRTNTAYERWWEGRKIWGALVNCSRNLAIKLKVSLTDTDFYKKAIPLYSQTLRKHLQEHDSEIEDFHLLKIEKHQKHKPNAVAMQIWFKINEAHKDGKLNEAQLITLNADWQQLTEICGACERIKNTPIPFSYSAFIKKFLFFYTMFMPFAYVGTMEYMVIPLVIFIFYVLASIELIAEEIENPFGLDPNDLPLEHLCGVIKNSVEEIFNSKSDNIKL